MLLVYWDLVPNCLKANPIYISLRIYENSKN